MHIRWSTPSIPVCVCVCLQFVAHSNVQQLLGQVWYDGMPGFKRLSPSAQLTQIAKIGCLFPIYCFAFLFAPNSSFGAAMKKPFIKFIVHSATYCCFLCEYDKNTSSLVTRTFTPLAFR